MPKFKRDNHNLHGIVLFDDYVQIYEPTLSHGEIMCIAEEFVKTHGNKVIIFAATSKNLTEFSKKTSSTA
jgi:hypothetical protein